MKHRNSVRRLARPLSRILCVLLFVNLIVVTHPSAGAAADESHFIDPSAIVQCGAPYNPCSFGSGVYIGPFAILRAGGGAHKTAHKTTPFITIGNGSNVQDNTLLDTTTNNRPITLGDGVIIAHGASVYGGAQIGMSGECPPSIFVCASFLGFNSEVAEDAIVERNAMVTHLARVGPGVRIPSGRVVPPGKNIERNTEVMAKTVPITDADREFMDAVIRVNLALAAGYTKLEQQDPTNVCGVNVNPVTDFTPESVLPTFNNVPMRIPNSPSRIIGAVRLANVQMPRMGRDVSLRADEGTPFTVGTVTELKDFATFHALEHTQLRLGNGGTYGIGSLMHGGKFNDKVTSTGNDFQLGDNSVFYSSTAGTNCRIGAMSFVSDTNLGDNAVVPPRVVVLRGTQTPVDQWVRRPRPRLSNNHDRCPR